ncbi:MAG: 1,3-beta-galactosyl-N-acetylhexosamine phosphorylase, partial [Clostridiaceae bacterium]|nr:1,3-beta-galactosyl-N-acetylhexosamine phosphorylase [Clostridiaceae bacterium]
MNKDKLDNLTVKNRRDEALTGSLTLPSEENFYDETLEMLELLGADAIRNSDGTTLPENLKDLAGVKVYTNFFPSRGHNEFALDHLTECSRFYLSSEFITAESEELEIAFCEDYFSKQIKPDYDNDPYAWWEVMNRTTGEPVPTSDWFVDQKTDTIVIKTTPYHVYSVNFLAYGVWDPVHMYNHITNDWGDEVERDIAFDVRYPNSSEFAEQAMEQWLIDNPKTDVVRFTTFFYQFSLVFNSKAEEKYVDWFGYTNTVSPLAIEAFEQEYGYRLRPEDFVDEGYYNSTFRIPSKQYLDYMDFQQRFVAKKAKALVDLVHKYDKKAIMFLGDQWIGTEPYGKYFSSIGLDGVVGSVGDGVTLRLISDIDVKIREGRFLPYFFPDTFFEGNDEAILEEAKLNWIKARRALFRSPLTRIGYGGYLSLAYQFKDFIAYIAEVAQEFRQIKQYVESHQSLKKSKVAILNSWGAIRTWAPYIVAHGKPYKLSYSYLGMMEALSGMAVDVQFINFDDLKAGIDPDIDVIINAGDAHTAFSGGEIFTDEAVVSALRKFVHAGGGLIGLGDPTAYQANGRFFQLADVFGIDKEVGYSQST